MAGSPRAMVNALNGSTTVKMLVVLTAVTIYLLAGGEYRVQFALGLFAVFAAQSVLFVSCCARPVVKKVREQVGWAGTATYFCADF